MSPKKDLQKWKRHQKCLRLFSRYDEGIKISEIMMYSVTPEVVAHEIAQRAFAKGFRQVVDGCGGAGGNAIAFAENGFHVAHVELDPSVLADAKHNARIYAVQEWIEFVQMDVLQFDVVEQVGFDPQQTLFFSSPEWGGPRYKHSEIFDLEDLNPPISKLLVYAKEQKFKEICIFVPRTSNLDQASTLGCYVSEYMYVKGWCVALCLWFKGPYETQQDKDSDSDSDTSE